MRLSQHLYDQPVQALVKQTQNEAAPEELQRSAQSLVSLILGSLVSFFPGSLVSFFSGHWCLFASFAATVSSESPFKLFLATSGLSVWVYSFWGFGLGVLLCSFIRVSVWVYSISTFGLGLLL